MWKELVPFGGDFEAGIWGLSMSEPDNAASLRLVGRGLLACVLTIAAGGLALVAFELSPSLAAKMLAAWFPLRKSYYDGAVREIALADGARCPGAESDCSSEYYPRSVSFSARGRWYYVYVKDPADEFRPDWCSFDGAEWARLSAHWVLCQQDLR